MFRKIKEILYRSLENREISYQKLQEIMQKMHHGFKKKDMISNLLTLQDSATGTKQKRQVNLSTGFASF